MEKIEKIGIFILNYNGIKWLKKTLKNIVHYTQDTKIIIIDNNSSDQSINYINAHFPDLEVIANKANLGFAKGYNQVLLKEFRFKYYILINNDVIVTKNWMKPMLKLIKTPDIGIIQPKIKSLKNKKKFDYAGAAGGFIDLFGIPFCRGRMVKNIEIDYEQYDNNMNIFWASGCCFMITSDLFQSLKGFDEDLFMHQEEIDLCWRAQTKNKKSYYCFESTIYHYGGGSLNKNDFKKHYYNHRNSLLILLKNLSFYQLIIIFILRLLLDYLIILNHIIIAFKSVLQFIAHRIPFVTLKEKLIIPLAILIAHFSVLKLLPKFLKKRQPIKSQLIYKGSILFDYYIRRKTKFSDLKKF